VRARIALAVAAWTLGAGLARADTDPNDPSSLHAPHRDPDGRFFNPWQPMDSSFGKFLRWRLSNNPYDKSEEPNVPVVANNGASLARPVEGAELTWVGHATVAIHDGADVALTDPHFSPRAFLPRRHQPPGIPLASVPADAFAVVSHSHYDHLDSDTVEELPASVGWYVPLGMGEFFRERGRSDVTELDWWQSAKRGRWTITCLPSQHWSLRLGASRNETLWCAWLLDSGERRYFFAGDTGYFAGFAQMGRELPPIDVAILPIGAYEPRWIMAYQHMDPAQAYQAFRDLGARDMLGVHWGTFDLTDEPLDEAPRELTRAVKAAGGDASHVHVLPIGGTWKLEKP
jgi:N-acyl-phosphatidylethanolamine-hydrolysing phospholipase D